MRRRSRDRLGDDLIALATMLLFACWFSSMLAEGSPDVEMVTGDEGFSRIVVYDTPVQAFGTTSDTSVSAPVPLYSVSDAVDDPEGFPEDTHTAVASRLQLPTPSIDTLVMMPPADSPDFYLTHDPWGRERWYGTPYLDDRSGPDAFHRLVYGHNFGSWTKVAFSPLGDVWQEEVFKRIDHVSWITPDDVVETYTPLCALIVDAEYATIQKFHPEDATAWLHEVLNDAKVRSINAEALCENPSSVLTLVTCSGFLVGGSSRTILVCVAA